MAFRGLLHEMAHGWLDANLSEIERARFLDLRRLSTWNSPEVSHDERGFEQAAEIMAWTLSAIRGTGSSGRRSLPLPSKTSAPRTESLRGTRFRTGDPELPFRNVVGSGSVRTRLALVLVDRVPFQHTL